MSINAEIINAAFLFCLQFNASAAGRAFGIWGKKPGQAGFMGNMKLSRPSSFFQIPDSIINVGSDLAIGFAAAFPSVAPPAQHL